MFVILSESEGSLARQTSGQSRDSSASPQNDTATQGVSEHRKWLGTDGLQASLLLDGLEEFVNHVHAVFVDARPVGRRDGGVELRPHRRDEGGAVQESTWSAARRRRAVRKGPNGCCYERSEALESNKRSANGRGRKFAPKTAWEDAAMAKSIPIVGEGPGWLGGGDDARRGVQNSIPSRNRFSSSRCEPAAVCSCAISVWTRNGWPRIRRRRWRELATVNNATE